MTYHYTSTFFIDRVLRARCDCGWKAEIPTLHLAGLGYEQRLVLLGLRAHVETARRAQYIETAVYVNEHAPLPMRPDPDLIGDAVADAKLVKQARIAARAEVTMAPVMPSNQPGGVQRS